MPSPVGAMQSAQHLEAAWRSILQRSTGPWCNGSTRDFGSLCSGSNPDGPTFHPPSRRPSGDMTAFFSALSFPFRGIAYFLRRPGLWKYFVAAFAINVILFAVLAYLFFQHRTELVDWLLPARWWGWLRTGLGWLFTLVVAVAGLFLFTIVGNILASPFLDAMTERILRDLGETLPPPRGVLRALGRSVVNQLLKLVFFGAIQAALLLLQLLPGIGTVLHPVLSTFVGVVFLGFEYLDYP